MDDIRWSDSRRVDCVLWRCIHHIISHCRLAQSIHNSKSQWMILNGQTVKGLNCTMWCSWLKKYKKSTGFTGWFQKRLVKNQHLNTCNRIKRQCINQLWVRTSQPYTLPNIKAPKQDFKRQTRLTLKPVHISFSRHIYNNIYTPCLNWPSNKQTKSCEN